MAYKGETKLGNLFQSRREKGEIGLPTLSVTMTNGLINRDELERKTDTNLSSEEHLLVKKDDIAYNMMRMWQGASGLAKKDGVISPAYIVLKPVKSHIDPLFASYLFKSKRIIYLFWAYSYGLTGDRLRLYFKDFKKIPVNVPSISEQQKIARILLTWDKAIETTETLIENSRQQKRALMQQLLSGKKKLPGFNGKWKEVKLSEIADILVSNVDKKTVPGEDSILLCNYTDVYHNDFITNDINFMMATASENQIIKYKLQHGDVLITKDSESPDDIAVPAFVDDNFEGVLCGYHLAIIRPDSDKADGVFLSNLFSLPKIRYYFYTLANGVTRFGLGLSSIKSAVFHVPSLPEQQAIAKTLRNSSELILNQLRQLETLKIQKHALMQQLLTGKRRVKLEQ